MTLDDFERYQEGGFWYYRYKPGGAPIPGPVAEPRDQGLVAWGLLALVAWSALEIA